MIQNGKCDSNDKLLDEIKKVFNVHQYITTIEKEDNFAQSKIYNL
jgi:hypothetical protein